MKTIYISTSDELLSDELCNLKMPGVEVITRLRAAVTLDQATDFVLHVAGNVSLGVLGSWLYDQIKKGDPKKTTIQSQYIVYNPVNVTIVINQSPNDEPQESHSEDSPPFS